LTSGQAKKFVEFIAPDGIRYAKSTKVEEILNFPHFLVRVDNI
jgi:hypothetical protein